jgi:hypothetical protein
MKDEKEQFTEADEKQFQEANKMSMFIKGSLRWRLAYFHMRFLMVIEGFLWSFMDITRAKRMRVSARINKNYQNFV